MPTKDDLKSIVRLHEAAHDTKGMFGSIDCMHTVWKNCPVAWQGNYKGKEKVPSIVMEAISDYHMWFWHAAYGYAGTMNDKTILNLSPFLESLVDGTFKELESAIIPYEILGQLFDLLFVLCDGIYPAYSRFVKTISEPVTQKEKLFSAWQEACRKDIERAFGVLQGQFQYMARPFMEMKLDYIGKKVGCCLILHNMCVSDHVMSHPRDRYNPSESVVEGDMTIEYPDDRVDVQGGELDAGDRAITGVANMPTDEQHRVTRRMNWYHLMDQTEHSRLHVALINYLYGQ